MSWHYVIARERVDDLLGGTDDVFSVRELYVNDDGGIKAWSAEPIAPHGETWHEIVDDLVKMQRAYGGRVLDLTLDPPQLVKRTELAK